MDATVKQKIVSLQLRPSSSDFDGMAAAPKGMVPQPLQIMKETQTLAPGNLVTQDLGTQEPGAFVEVKLAAVAIARSCRLFTSLAGFGELN